MPIKVALIEDRPQARQDIVRLLRSIPGVEVTSVHVTAEEALESLPVLKVNLAIVDAVLPRMSGIELVRELKERRPDLPVLILTAYDDPEKIFSALAAGADGYVLKSSLATELAPAIRHVLNGGAPLTPSVARKIIQHFRKLRSQDPEVASLTDRELAVLREVATGRTYEEIGKILDIKPETVRAHVGNAKEKLHVTSRFAAALRVVRR